ncbi:hypothetical protein HBI56_046650 [Parastagonospora nodorum]|nr:hypothetical protein HBH53_018390 [Parastagonospora nodorum]KAH3965365.1 hypothetical protein HBH51_152460 [Parastagonospora nodorum]KAH3977464.1 hypothetical protein HBH52_112790 [Parastagonospora nodorum]KAH4000141.1 hypothetical protein HBI10_108950 [Parastagonospora nodorum]KAH4022260.1 hypothetical protein HBI13_100220 [Parastagonospora nodorum]
MAPFDILQRLYQPLDRNSIRILCIKPGFPSEPIECAFVNVADLAESPPYTALSYVWGKEGSANPIICNGVQKDITKQLADALKHLRRYPGWRSVLRWPEDHPLRSNRNAWNGFARNRHESDPDDIGDGEVLLWVDALCINQDDNIERANQVKMMGKIYAHASNVSIWFGNEDREPLDFVQKKDLRSGAHIGAYGRIPISLSFIAQALRNTRGPKHRLATLRPVGDSVHRNAVYGFPGPNAPEWDVMRQFFTNAWFERVWVVQEAVLASKATVLLGDWEIEWAAIGEAAVWFQSEGYAMPAVLRYQMRDQQHFLPVSRTVSAWTLCSWPDHRIPLLDLLSEFRNRQATNPKDKVYATFGIAEELAHLEENGLHELLEPDYKETKTVAEVYRDIAKFLIIEHGHLGVLSHVGKSLEPDWPSWVPDWRQDKASNILSMMQGTDTYNASGDQSLQVGISENPYTISLHGIEADVITAYGDKLASYGFGYVTYQEEVDFARMAWELSQSIHTSDSDMNESIISTFIQTLVTGFSTEPSFQEDALQWFAQHVQLSLHKSRYRRLKYLMQKRSDPGRFHEVFVQACVDRRFFVTKNGLMGVGPDGMNEGDVIGILFGGRVPYVLRPVDDGFRFVGECYVSGLMNGEAVQTWKDEGSKKHVFELVQA